MAHSDELHHALAATVGKRHVFTGEGRTAYYRTGFRYGKGSASAVVFPGTLVEQWRVLQVCVEHGAAIVMQAAKSGLTGGSVPSGDDYGRPVVIVNVMRIKRIVLLDGGKQAIALPGSTLHELTELLRPLGRVPHSVIGSTTIGATVVGGIANNAGGALCKRGSSYTRLSMFARVNENRELELVNQLGIEGLGEDPETILSRLEREPVAPDAVVARDVPASDHAYADRIRDLQANVPNRYNTDPRRLCGVSGSAGKVAAFAVRVDTFPAPKRRAVFYLGTNDPLDFVRLRQDVLGGFTNLPEMGEYMNRQTFDTAERYGKDVFLSIKYLGTERLPKAYKLKAASEHVLNQVPLLPKYLPDRVLNYASRLFPQHLPKSLRDYRNRFEHLLLLDTTDDAIEETRAYLAGRWKGQGSGDNDYFECNQEEQAAGLRHRFAAAGAGLRYQTMHSATTEEELALDIARISRDDSWTQPPPAEVTDHLDRLLRYGHFFCYVFHDIYIFRKGTDLERMKQILLGQLDETQAKYPAEHNVGHLYKADDTLQKFYAELDPTNTFNPGIGKTGKGVIEPQGEPAAEKEPSLSK
ncbi:MAG: D-lactate dehydrogenase [Planctomycetota bacterium]